MDTYLLDLILRSSSRQKPFSIQGEEGGITGEDSWYFSLTYTEVTYAHGHLALKKSKT